MDLLPRAFSFSLSLYLYLSYKQASKQTNDPNGWFIDCSYVTTKVDSSLQSSPDINHYNVFPNGNAKTCVWQCMDRMHTHIREPRSTSHDKKKSPHFFESGIVFEHSYHYHLLNRTCCLWLYLKYLVLYIYLFCIIFISLHLVVRCWFNFFVCFVCLLLFHPFKWMIVWFTTPIHTKTPAENENKILRELDSVWWSGD